MKYIVLFFLSITTLWAQDTTTTKRYHYKVWIKPSLSINYLAVDIEDSPININLKNKTILPNYPLTMGLGLGVHNTYVNLDYARGLMPLRNENKYGKTSYFDFQIHSFISNKFLLDLYYQSYKGFYYENAQDIHLLKDARVQQIGSEFLYFTKWRETSLKNIFNPEGNRLKPLFSFYVGGGVFYHKLSLPLIDPDRTDDFKHIQAGLSGGVANLWQLAPNLTFSGLVGLGFYFGGETAPISKMKINQYVNFRYNIALTYKIKNSTIDFSILHNNKRVNFNNSDLVSIKNTTLKISFTQQLNISTRHNNKVMRFLGM